MARYLIGNIKGPAGENGISPSASVTQTSTGATITITDTSGTTTANITNGKDGAAGPTYTAGTGIDITNNVISATGGSVTESDPVFSASPAASITTEDIAEWDAKSDFSGSYEDLTNKPDLSGFATTDALTSGLASKQDTLTAGTNITIENNVISASGGDPVGYKATDNTTIKIGASNTGTAAGYVLGYGNKLTTTGGIPTIIGRGNQSVFGNGLGGGVMIGYNNVAHSEATILGNNIRVPVRKNAFGTYVGKFNNDSASGDPVFVVGVGTSESNRKNGLTLDTSGNMVVLGKATVGTAPTDDMDVATKKYVDDNAGGGSSLPAIAAGDAGKVLTVNSTEDGTEWTTVGGSSFTPESNALISWNGNAASNVLGIRLQQSQEQCAYTAPRANGEGVWTFISTNPNITSNANVINNITVRMEDDNSVSKDLYFIINENPLDGGVFTAANGESATLEFHYDESTGWTITLTDSTWTGANLIWLYVTFYKLSGGGSMTGSLSETLLPHTLNDILTWNHSVTEDENTNMVQTKVYASAHDNLSMKSSNYSNGTLNAENQIGPDWINISSYADGAANQSTSIKPNAITLNNGSTDARLYFEDGALKVDIGGRVFTVNLTAE